MTEKKKDAPPVVKDKATGKFRDATEAEAEAIERDREVIMSTFGMGKKELIEAGVLKAEE